MLTKKFIKFVYEYSKNCRISTNKLGKLLRTSQQSASYLIQSVLKKQQLMGFHTLIDPARFGLLNVIVLLNYKNFDAERISELMTKLKSNEYITQIEETRVGADLFLEYVVPNLSFFNKENSKCLDKFRNDVSVIAIYPVIVRYIFSKKYLSMKADFEEVVVSGDRDVIHLNANQNAVLRKLIESPKSSIVEISKVTHLDPKTVVKIIKYLNAEQIIRKFSIIPNYNKLRLLRKHILIQLDNNEDVDSVIAYCRIHKNIVSATKLIGKYELIITMEKINEQKDIVSDIRKKFKVVEYQLLNVKNLLKKQSVPNTIFLLHNEE